MMLFLFLFLSTISFSQQLFVNESKTSFFSSAPLEDISAVSDALDGVVDEVRIYNRVLTKDDIKILYDKKLKIELENPVVNKTRDTDFIKSNITETKLDTSNLNKVKLDIFTLCPHGDDIWYESLTDKDCLSSDVKYIGSALFGNYLTIPNQGKVKTLIPHGKGKILYGNNKLMFKGIWKDGKKFNVKYYSSASGAILGSYINGYYFKKEVK